MTPPSLLSEDTISRAAFLLLTSSVRSRYVRMARQVGEEVGLADRLRVNPTLVSETIQRVAALWTELTELPLRDIQEIEIAVLVAALVDAGVPGLEPLLREMAESNARSTTWVSALAIHLLQEMRESSPGESHRVVQASLVRPLGSAGPA